MQRFISRLTNKKVFRRLATKSLILVAVLLIVGSSLGLAQQNTFEINTEINTELTTSGFTTSEIATSDFNLDLQETFGNTFLVDNFSTINNNLSVGFIHLQSQNNSLLFDGGAKVTVANLVTDALGYSEKGFEISLTSKSNPYAVNGLKETSEDLLLSTSFFQSLDSLTGISLSTNLGLSGYTEFSLQASYNSTDTNSPFSALGIIGYRQSFDTQLPIVTSAVRIERISVEPKVRAWYDSDFSFGADVAVRADTSIFNASNLSLGLEGGYTDGFWYNFTVNSPIKF